MAIKNTVQIDVQAKGDGSIKSIRQELREAQQSAVQMARTFGENSEQAIAAARNVAKLRDEIEDTGIKIKSLNPDKLQRIATIGQGVAQGFVAAQGAMALFGTESKDLEKTMVKLQGAIALSQGLQGVKDLQLQFAGMSDLIKKQVVAAFTTLRGALASLGIGLLITALVYLANNFDKVKDAVMKFAPWLQTVGDGIMYVVHAVTDFVGITSEAERAFDDLAEANKKLNEETKRQIAILEASGATTEDIYWKKKELWEREIKELEAKQNAGIKLTDDENKKMYDLWTEYYVEDAKRKKALRDEQKKHDDELKAQRDKAAEEKKKRDIELSEAAFDAMFKQFEEQASWEQEIINRNREALKQENDAWFEAQQELYNFVNEGQAEAEKKAIDAHKQSIEQRVLLTKAGLQTVGELITAFTANNEAAQKKAFDVQKGINIAMTTIDTYMAAQSAYRSQMLIATPDAPVRATIAAAIAIAQGLARVVAIKNTQYKSTQSPTMQSLSGGITAPSVSQQVQQQGISGNLTGTTGTVTQNNRVYVVETDISAAQQRVGEIKRRATIK